MNLTNQYLYNNITTVNLHDDSATRIWNGNMYDRQLKLYKGITNSLRFVIKNQDQKPVNILTKTVTFILMDQENHISLIERAGIIINGAKGISEVKILDIDMLNINAKYYNYAVKVTDAEGDESITYNDLAFNVSGTVEVLDHVYPTFVASTESFVTEHTRDTEILPDSTTVIRHVSENFLSNSSLHAIQLFLTSFTGVVTIQGTMNLGDTLVENDWADITTNESPAEITLTAETGTKGYTFSGIYNRVRVKYRFTSGVLGAEDGPLVDAGLTASSYSGNASGSVLTPVFIIGETFWFNTTKVSMSGTTATTFAADINALEIENITSNVNGNGSVNINYTGGSTYDLSYSGIDKILYRS